MGAAMIWFLALAIPSVGVGSIVAACWPKQDARGFLAFNGAAILFAFYMLAGPLGFGAAFVEVML